MTEVCTISCSLRVSRWIIDHHSLVVEYAHTQFDAYVQSTVNNREHVDIILRPTRSPTSAGKKKVSSSAQNVGYMVKVLRLIGRWHVCMPRSGCNVCCHGQWMAV